jgi:dolichol kinase
MNTPAPYSEMKRKAEHIAPLGFAFTLTIFPKWLVFALSITAIVYGVFISKRVVKGTLREAEQARGYSIGKTAYGIMVLILLVLFHTRMYVVAGAWAIMALGDGSASIFGTRWGRKKLPWNSEKSWAGLFGFLIVGTTACAFLLWYIQSTGDVGTTIDGVFAAFSAADLVGIAIAATVLCALAETLKIPLDDNILVPGLAGMLLFLITRFWP